MRIERFTQRAQQAILEAQQLAEAEGHSQLEAAHLLLTLAEQPDGVVPSLLERVSDAGDRFAAAGWRGAGLLRAREGDAFAAWERGVIVIPAGEDGRYMSATPPLTITDAEIDEAVERIG